MKEQSVGNHSAGWMIPLPGCFDWVLEDLQWCLKWCLLRAWPHVWLTERSVNASFPVFLTRGESQLLLV